jgi:hypothetical protein
LFGFLAGIFVVIAAVVVENRLENSFAESPLRSTRKFR